MSACGGMRNKLDALPLLNRSRMKEKTEKRAKPGSIIYGFFRHTYGVVSTPKSWARSMVTFTLNKDGGEPFFTMPMTDVRKIVQESEVPNQCQMNLRK